MTRRTLLLMVVLTVVVLFVWPAAAQAGSQYRITDAKGHVRGRLVSADRVIWKVVNRRGAQVGSLFDGYRGTGNCAVYHAPAAGGPLSAVGSGRLLTSGGVAGRAIRTRGRWLLQRRIGGRYRTVASVPLGCHPWDALGAAWLLLWPHTSSAWGTWKITGRDYAATVWSSAMTDYPGELWRNPGPGASVWVGSGLKAAYLGEVCHEMDDAGAVPDLWLSQYDGLQIPDKWIKYVNDDLYTIIDSDGNEPIRAIRSTSGAWQLQLAWDGDWLNEDTIPGGCPGAWAAGAYLLLPPEW
jgi:hypothetical protein